VQVVIDPENCPVNQTGTPPNCHPIGSTHYVVLTCCWTGNTYSGPGSLAGFPASNGSYTLQFGWTLPAPSAPYPLTKAIADLQAYQAAFWGGARGGGIIGGHSTLIEPPQPPFGDCSPGGLCGAAVEAAGIAWPCASNGIGGQTCFADAMVDNAIPPHGYCQQQADSNNPSAQSPDTNCTPTGYNAGEANFLATLLQSYAASDPYGQVEFIVASQVRPTGTTGYPYPCPAGAVAMGCVYGDGIPYSPPSEWVTANYSSTPQDPSTAASWSLTAQTTYGWSSVPVSIPTAQPVGGGA